MPLKWHHIDKCNKNCRKVDILRSILVCLSSSTPWWLSQLNTLPCSHLVCINLDLGSIVGCLQVLSFKLWSSSIVQSHPYYFKCDVQMMFHFPLFKMAQNTYDVAIWHLLFILPQWCLVLPACGRATWHKEMWVQFKHFLASNQENL